MRCAMGRAIEPCGGSAAATAARPSGSGASVASCPRRGSNLGEHGGACEAERAGDEARRAEARLAVAEAAAGGEVGGLRQRRRHLFDRVHGGHSPRRRRAGAARRAEGEAVLGAQRAAHRSQQRVAGRARQVRDAHAARVRTAARGACHRHVHAQPDARLRDGAPGDGWGLGGAWVGAGLELGGSWMGAGWELGLESIASSTAKPPGAPTPPAACRAAAAADASPASTA
eukprot:scaffold48832_cov55-Phaeocystis_antarctica.AAC.1